MAPQGETQHTAASKSSTKERSPFRVPWLMALRGTEEGAQSDICPDTEPQTLDEVPDSLLPATFLHLSVGVAKQNRRWLESLADAELKMSGARVRLLALINEHERVKMTELAQTLDVTPRAITRLVDGLEDMGYVHRERDVDDRRVIYVVCEDQARELIRTGAKKALDQSLEMFSDLDPQHLREAISLMAEIGQCLRQYTELAAEAGNEEE